MDHKSDSGDSPFPAFVPRDVDDDVDEFDNADTSEVAGMFAVPIGENRADWGLEEGSGRDQANVEHPEQTDDDVLEPGFVLRDRFEIIELVHAGGMGRVYKAIDRNRHEGGSEQIHVAIKMMRRSLAPRLDASLALEREAAKTQKLSHPNIVNVYDFDEHDEQFYLVMEWLEGESVNALLKRTTGQPQSPESAWELIEEIAAGLQHAHSNHVVHADINPSNIFITQAEDVKLLDFGVARYANDPDYAVGEGPVWATRTYASPQVLSGATPEFEDDVFSLACVAYRLLSGKHPFGGKSSVEAEQAGVTVPPIPGLAEARWQVLSHALSYSRSERPSSASAFFVDPSVEERPALFDRLREDETARRVAVAAIAALAILGSFWWLSQSGVPDQPSANVETAPPETEPDANVTELTETSAMSESLPGPELVADSAAPIELSRLEVLLDDAARAVADGRLVTPADDNARDRYRAVLALDATNSNAMSGLRAISDVYVQRANAALRTDAPTQAVSALAIAADTDPQNPAVAIVNELLVAESRSRLANAQLAAAEGDLGRATALLSDAERYAAVDEAAASSVRNQITRNLAEQEFLATLSTADEHIRAGRLLAPTGGNAYEVLSELQSDHQGDARLLVSLERLAERLLASSAFAVAAEQYDEAGALLDAAEILGVLAPQVRDARLSLQQAVETPATPAIAAAATQEQRFTTLADLDIEKFVAPRYPRGAKRRGLVGFVDVRFRVNANGSTSDIETVRSEPGDVFAASAEKAVSEWRFAQREESVLTRATLRFELDQQ